MIKVQYEGIKLAMWEKTELPEREKDANGDWKNTGKKVEKTTYTFKDEFGDKLVLLSNNEYRELEGRQCDIVIGITYNDYDRKNRITLEGCNPGD